MHLAGFLFFAYLLVPAKKGAKGNIPPWYDIICAVLSIIPPIYYAIYIAPYLTQLAAVVSTEYTIMGWILTLLILEMVRRALGYVFLGIIVLFIIYALTANHWPGIFYGLQQPYDYLGSWFLLSDQGILIGSALRVSSIIIVSFLLFGAILVNSGAAKVFIDGAFGLMGRFRGGPAKIAVAGSAALGMLTGSSVSNVMTTGVLTIPLMKQNGYHKNFAGAVEAVASNGGMLMPPVMGAVIFIMVAFTGIPYYKIVIASFIPAFMYFWALYLAVDFEASKTGLKGLPKDSLPSVRRAIKEGWFYIPPVVFLLYLLLGLELAPQKAVLWSTVLLLITVAFKKESKVGLKGLVSSAWDTMEGMFLIIPGVAAAGILVVCLQSTGLGTALAGGIIDITGGNLIFMLLIAAAVCYIMGMGMSLVAIYLVLAVLIAPALVQAGMPVMAAHLFAVWWSVTFFITPPVAPCVFAACAISGGDILKTGLQAMRLAGPIYILPFAFALGPAMLLLGTPTEIIISVVTAWVGVTAMAGGLSGWLMTKTGWLERILLVAGSIALILPYPVADIVGLGLVVVATFINLKAFRSARARRNYTDSGLP